MDIQSSATFLSNALPPQAFSPAKNVAGRQEVAAGMLEDRVSLTPVLRGGIENIRTLGTLVLGGEAQLEEWEAKGLVVTDETLSKAYDVLNASFKEHLENSRNQATSFNRHQIIASSQAVPDWFLLEYENELASIAPPDVQRSFSSGALYHLAETAPSRSEINTYTQVASLGQQNDLSRLFPRF
ncbi:MAG: hypothetical protein WA987_11220 [Cellvibrio sp.]